MPTTPPPPQLTDLVECDPDSLQMHSHICKTCQHIWHHRAQPPVLYGAHLQAHLCPNCSAHPGARPWSIWRGPGSQAALVAPIEVVAISA